MTDFDEIRDLLDKSRSKDSDFRETLIKRTTELVEKLLLESIKSSLQDNVRNLVFGVEIYDLDTQTDSEFTDKNKLDLTGMFCQMFEMKQGTNVGIIKYNTINKILNDGLHKLDAKFSITLGWLDSDCHKFSLTQPVRCGSEWSPCHVIIPESIKIKQDFIPFRLHHFSSEISKYSTPSFQQLDGRFTARYDSRDEYYTAGEQMTSIHDDGYKTDRDGDSYSYVCRSYGPAWKPRPGGCHYYCDNSGCRLGNPMIIAVVQFP